MAVETQITPVIVVGAGLSGLATALGVALGGRPVIVLEAADLVGGAAAFSGGQVWVGANHVAAREGLHDDLDLTERYVRGIAAAHPEALDEAAMRRWLAVAPEATRYWEDVGAIRWAVIPEMADYHVEVPGAVRAGRYLTNEPIDGSLLGEWRRYLRVSPHFPVGLTYAEMYVKGRRGSLVDDEDGAVAQHAGVPAFGLPDSHQPAGDEGRDRLTFGTGVVASFLARALREDRVEIRRNTRVTELITDGGEHVIGVRARDPNGELELTGPVVLATSTYDWDPDLVREFLGLEPDDFGSVAPQSLRGDGIRLARSVGGATARIPATSVPILPGWTSRGGTGYGYGPEYALPHCMIVDAAGRRFCDDSYWPDIVGHALAPDDRHLPFFLIWDEQHHRSYGLGETPPGEPYPDGMVTSSDTLSDLGRKLGIDGEVLERTAARFSAHADSGEDPEFGRGTVPVVRRFAGDPNHEPNPTLGPITEPPFHGLRLKFVGTGIGSSGVHIDGDAHVLDDNGAPIPNLYAVGSCAALTQAGSGYNSGFALGRGLTLAYLAARQLRGDPVPV
ncbi:MAG TPA: FAD-dependent oxidoreductase [Solirubrobacteraceae bacterium]|nr:FAD-dependent oxidoreductase [Solirubrobacteraceae bacterium]